MNKHTAINTAGERQVDLDVGRRALLKLTGASIAAGMMPAFNTPVFAQTTLGWDKTFPKSARVDLSPSDPARGRRNRAFEVLQ